jgi:competence protein ComEA
MQDLPRSTLVAWVVAALLGAAAIVALVRGGGEPAPRVRLDPPAAAPGRTAAEDAGATHSGAPTADGARAAGATAAGGSAPAGSGGEGAWVHIAGAVRRPGVYLVPPRARVTAAVEAAGGPARRADLAGVNLAARVVDGQQVVVPARGRASAGAAGAGAAGAGRATAAWSGAGAAPISLSTATQPELETLPGIGPALAGRIVGYRERHGGFRSVDELSQVEGIGPKRLEALRDAVGP